MMLFSVSELVSEVTELITLEPGDIIATGTPLGPDELNKGDTVGILVNHVTTR